MVTHGITWLYQVIDHRKLWRIMNSYELILGLWQALTSQQQEKNLWRLGDFLKMLWFSHSNPLNISSNRTDRLVFVGTTPSVVASRRQAALAGRAGHRSPRRVQQRELSEIVEITDQMELYNDGGFIQHVFWYQFTSWLTFIQWSFFTIQPFLKHQQGHHSAPPSRTHHNTSWNWAHLTIDQLESPSVIVNQRVIIQH